MKPTKPFLELAPGARGCALGPRWRVKDVADASRSAALGFAWGANRGWGRRELARWLAGPYARAVAATGHLRRAGDERTIAYREVDPKAVEDLLVTTHARVVEVLRTAWSWPCDASLAREIVDAGLVVGVSDANGDIGYAPADRADMRLIDRVRSLFVADYLTRPHDYISFGVCDGCDGVTFDVSQPHDDCSSAFRSTTPTLRIVFRRREPRPTLLGVGEGVGEGSRRDTDPTFVLPWEEDELAAAGE